MRWRANLMLRPYSAVGLAVPPAPLEWQADCDVMTRPSVALQAHRERILQIARAHGARNVRVFGSAARGTDREGSDVDLLVDVDEGATLFTLTGLEQALNELLGVPVDVRTPAEISRYIRDRVLAEARPL
jgi:uncharacterized protein